MKSEILWEKWRPKKIEEIVLPERILSKFVDGVKQHYIFYGKAGCGKTSLARILIGKYRQGSNYMEINCSEDTSIDILRNEISEFCKNKPLFDDGDGMKYVFLDEFDRVSAQFQDGFKAFIEKYNNRNVRFIISTNHFNKVIPELKSRIKAINFDSLNTEEETLKLRSFFKRITETIIGGEIEKQLRERIATIVKRKSPDFRSILVDIQDLLDNGIEETIQKDEEVVNNLYRHVTTNTSYVDSYKFLMENFGPEKIDYMISLLSRPFIDWIISKNLNSELLFEVNRVICLNSQLVNETDPVVVGMNVIGEIKKLFVR